jgi:hypothetical protein
MKLVVSIELAWQHGTHDVEIELDSADYEDYTSEELEPIMAEIAEDAVNNEVSYGWRVVYD